MAKAHSFNPREKRVLNEGRIVAGSWLLTGRAVHESKRHKLSTMGNPSKQREGKRMQVIDRPYPSQGLSLARTIGCLDWLIQMGNQKEMINLLTGCGWVLFFPSIQNFWEQTINGKSALKSEKPIDSLSGVLDFNQELRTVEGIPWLCGWFQFLRPCEPFFLASSFLHLVSHWSNASGLGTEA